ncbi:MAG TPA: crossover junction endodeoxyribonuclease RuvC [Gammaproteobacteria bacterium]|nr:crossover junction endodeoxyribonuclease RuvC [Gammaproteobacteria bacterium]
MIAKTRIIGIDPGSRCTGYGVIDSDGFRHNYIASGYLKIKGDELPERLGSIFNQVAGVIEQWQPQSMGIEQVFVNKNVDSALKLGQARGAAICACVNAQLPVDEYTPRAIKKAVVGNGSADKQQIQQMMKILLKLDFVPQSDEADGLAIAVCHANHMQIKNRGIANKVRGGRWR